MAAIDYSTIPTEDLQALQDGDMGKVSTKTLLYLQASQSQEQPKTAPQQSSFTDQVANWAKNKLGVQGVPQVVNNYVDPLLRYGGAMGGAVMGSMPPASVLAPGASTVAGGALGYTMGGLASDKLKEALGMQQPPDFLGRISRTGQDLVSGAEQEMGGMAINPAMQSVGGMLKNAGLDRYLYGSALKTPTTGQWKRVLPSEELTRREGAINTGIQGEIPVNTQGLSLTQKNIQNAMATKKQILNEVSAQDGDVYGVIDIVDNALKSVRKDAQSSSSVESALGVVKKLRQVLVNRKSPMDANELEAFRKSLDSEIPWDKLPELSTAVDKQYTEKVKQGTVNYIRDILNEIPGVGDVNKTIKDNIFLSEAIKKSLDREGMNNAVSATSKLMSLRSIPAAIADQWLGRNTTKSNLAFYINLLANKHGSPFRITADAINEAINKRNYGSEMQQPSQYNY